MLTVYEDPWSPNCVKVRLVLREIAAVTPLKWRSVPVDLEKGEQRERRFLRLNPLGRVPVLVDGALTLSESGAILCYLAERYPKARLWPRGGRDQAELLQWLFFQGTELGPVVTNLYDELCFSEEGERHPDLIKAYKAELRQLLGVLADQLRRGRPRFLLGTHPSLADFAVLPSLDLIEDFAKEAGLSLGEWPQLQAYMDRLHERPSWQGVWPR